MSDKNCEIEKSLVTDLFDLIFDGKNMKVKTVGNMNSIGPEKMSKFALARSLLGRQIQEVEDEIKNSVLEGNFDSDNPLKELMRLARTWKAMKILTSFDENELPEIFITDSLFLIECYQKLFSEKVERELFLTGPNIGRFNVLTKRLHIEQKGRKNKVEDVPKSTLNQFRKLDKLGMSILGAFHSHPDSLRPRPSETDLAQFEKYEDHGLRTLGAIFTQNGLIRFFTKDLEFEILIAGEKIREKKGDLYQLELKEV